jgi:hypothetical protein
MAKKKDSKLQYKIISVEQNGTTQTLTVERYEDGELSRIETLELSLYDDMKETIKKLEGEK